MEILNEWIWYLQLIFIFLSLALISLLIGIRDAYRQKSEAARNKKDDEDSKKWNKWWHFVSGTLYGTMAVLFAYSVYGFSVKVIAIVGLALAARWWGVDFGFNIAMGLPFTYQGETSALDKSSSKNKLTLIILKSLSLVIAVLVVWLVFTKL